MEKLEAIFRAEESARHVEGEARDRVRTIRAEGLAEVELIRRSSAREASEQAEVVRAAVMRDADAAAVLAERDAEAELARLVSRAEERTPAAIEHVLRELDG